MENPSDQSIISGCILGDKAAAEAFVKRFSNLVYQSVQGALRARNLRYSKLDLEDLHNTVFLGLFEKSCWKLRQYKGLNGCSVSSWIRLITVRIVLDHLRKSQTDVLTRKEKLLPLDSVLAQESESAGQWALMERAERARLLAEGLKKLLPRERLFLKLHCEEGLPISEVAGIMKVTENNAHSIKHRAIKSLMSKMEQ
jgi:RNA polymerase sigma factor (sigma-70 family)